MRRSRRAECGGGGGGERVVLARVITPRVSARALSGAGTIKLWDASGRDAAAPGAGGGGGGGGAGKASPPSSWYSLRRKKEDAAAAPPFRRGGADGGGSFGGFGQARADDGGGWGDGSSSSSSIGASSCLLPCVGTCKMPPGVPARDVAWQPEARGGTDGRLFPALPGWSKRTNQSTLAMHPGPDGEESNLCGGAVTAAPPR